MRQNSCRDVHVRGRNRNGRDETVQLASSQEEVERKLPGYIAAVLHVHGGPGCEPVTLSGPGSIEPA